MTSFLNKLIEQLLNEREVFMYELLADKLVESTTEENYDHIIAAMRDHELSSELDISIYIAEISSRKYDGLMGIITELQKEFRDPDALEDLQTAISNMS